MLLARGGSIAVEGGGFNPLELVEFSCPIWETHAKFRGYAVIGLNTMHKDL
jgi:hypothetical protein